MINLDGKWEHDFADDKTPIKGKLKKKIKARTKNSEPIL